MRKLSGLLVLLAGCTGGGGDKNCSDFGCQQDAQAWHNAHPEDGLDGDGDGIACEQLPNCSSLPPHPHVILEPTSLRQKSNEWYLALSADSEVASGLVQWGPSPFEWGQMHASAACGELLQFEVDPFDLTQETIAVSLDVSARIGWFLQLSEGGAPQSGMFVLRSTPYTLGEIDRCDCESLGR
jgi:hypothetical protein